MIRRGLRRQHTWLLRSPQFPTYPDRCNTSGISLLSTGVLTGKYEDVTAPAPLGKYDPLRSSQYQTL